MFLYPEVVKFNSFYDICIGVMSVHKVNIIVQVAAFIIEVSKSNCMTDSRLHKKYYLPLVHNLFCALFPLAIPRRQKSVGSRFSMYQKDTGQSLFSISHKAASQM